jgi:hypothetical protein
VGVNTTKKVGNIRSGKVDLTECFPEGRAEIAKCTFAPETYRKHGGTNPSLLHLKTGRRLLGRHC